MALNSKLNKKKNSIETSTSISIKISIKENGIKIELQTKKHNIYFSLVRMLISMLVGQIKPPTAWGHVERFKY